MKRHVKPLFPAFSNPSRRPSERFAPQDRPFDSAFFDGVYLPSKAEGLRTGPSRWTSSSSGQAVDLNTIENDTLP